VTCGQQMMLGSASRPVVQLTSDSFLSTAGSVCSMMFNTDGSLAVEEDAVTTTYTTEWLNPNPNSPEAALYEIQRTQVSGTVNVSFTGTMTSGTWYPLTSQRGVSVISSASVNRSNTSTYSIRRASDGVVMVSGVSITVTSNF
jgi:hypothetical protein